LAGALDGKTSVTINNKTSNKTLDELFGLLNMYDIPAYRLLRMLKGAYSITKTVESIYKYSGEQALLDYSKIDYLDGVKLYSLLQRMGSKSIREHYAETLPEKHRYTKL